MIKTKQILIALAVIGANVLHNMPLHTASAAGSWYGTNTSTAANQWTTDKNKAVTSGLTLTVVDETTTVEEVPLTGVSNIYGGYTDGSLDVKNNAITFNTSDTTMIAAEVYGGYSENGNIIDNTVTISNGIFSNKIHGGKINNSYATTTARGNAVIIENGTFSKEIYGGFGAVGGVVENSLIINNGTFDAIVYGGDAVSGGAATNNTVTINNGTFRNKQVYGGVSNSGNATENEVIIKGGTFTGTTIIAGCAMKNPSGDATNNIVTIEGGTFSGVKLYGGFVTTGISSGNTLNLNTKLNGTAKEVKYFQNVNFTLPVGATSEVTMLKVGTTPMALAGITFTTDLNGLALTETGDYVTLIKNVDDSSFTPATSGLGHYILTIGEVNELVYSNGTPVAKGDYTIKQGGVKGDSGTTGSYTGSICGNTDGTGLNVTGGSLSPTRYSGNEIIIRRGTYSKVYGAYNNVNSTDTSYNTVNVYDGTFERELVGGYAYEGGNADGNTVNFHGGKVTVGDVVDVIVYGGMGINATGNTVNIYDGNFEKTGLDTEKIRVYAGYGNNSASGNELNITGGSFNVADAVFAAGVGASGGATDNVLNISGGNFMKPTNFYGGLAEGGSAERNSVTIDEGTFSKEVFGGKGYTGAKDNKVTIKDGTFTNTNSVYGGSSSNGPATGNIVNIEGGTFDRVKLYGGYTTSGTSTNNTLNLKTKMGGTAAEVKYFQNMNFTLPTGIADEDTMLSTATMAFDATKITIDVDPSGEFTIAEGTVINLIDASGEMTGTYSVDEIFGVAATEDSGVYSTDIAKVVKSGNVISLTMLGKYAQDVWYSIGSEEKILGSTAPAQTISGAEGDVVLYHGAGDNNEYGAITTTKSVTVGAETAIGKSFLVSGDLTADNGVTVAAKNTLNIAADNLKSDVANSGTVVLKEGTLAAGSTITGGTVNITGDVTANASDIAGDANTIDADKTLTLNGGTLGGNLSGAGKVTIGNGTDNAAVTAALAKFGNTGDLTVAANGTLVTGGELNRDIKGTGTVQLSADSTLSNGKKIDGTLDGNGKNVTIGAANSIDSFTLDKLTGSTNLTLDVDMGNFTADKIVATDFDGTVVVNGINITKDYAEGASELALPKASTSADEITYLGKSGGNGTTSVKDGQIVVTNKYKYTFTAGGVGKLSYRVDASDLTFKKFMEGTLGSPSPTTLSLTEDLLNLGDGIDSISQGPNSITINLNGHNLSSASASNITIGSGKTLNLKGGSASTDGTVDDKTGFSVAGTMNISGKTTIKGNITNIGTATFADTTTATGTLGGAGTYNNSGTLNIADASKLQMTNGLTNSGTLNLGGGTLGADITGDGITKILGEVTSARNITNSVEVASTGDFTVSGGMVAMVDNKGTMTVTGLESVTGEITNSGTLTTALEGISNWGSGNVTNSGTLNIIGGGELNGQNITNSGGTINLSGDYTLDWANAASGLVIDGGSVDASDSTLTLTGLTKENKNKKVKLLNLTNGATATGSWAGLQEGVVYNVKMDGTGIFDADNRLKTFKIEDGYFCVLAYGANFVPPDSPEDGIRTSAYHVANAMAESADSNVTTFIDGITNMADTGAAADTLNASMNIGEAGGVQHGAVSMVGYIGEAIGSNLSIIYRPILGENTRAAIRNVANEGDAKKARIEEIEVGKANEIMPVAHQEQKYEKMVWASYMHNKEDINGLRLDGVKQNGTAQYNGTTVGADLWSSNKVVGGVAIAYTTGDVNSVIRQAATKNEVKYYGVSVYNRWTNGKTGILADVGYMHSKNELTQHTVESELTADAKINSFTAGVRAEQLVKMGRSNLVPFAGVRYMHLRNGEYTLRAKGSDIQHFAPKNQNIITPQVGVGWNGEYKIEGSKWIFRPSAEVGYLWNLGDRDTESIVSFGGANDTIGYEVADKSSYYAKLGVEFKKDNVTLGVSFKYQKGDAVKNRKWNVNLNFSF